MATCRFLLENHAETATIKNGSAGSPTPPVRSEVSPFVMERALNDDRRSLWKAGASNGTTYAFGYQIDLDLGSSKSVSAVSLHGLSCPGGEISSIQGGFLNAYPGTYMSMGDASLSGTKLRDGGITFAAISKRYWYAWIDATAAPTIGRVKLGELVDLGVAPNPGSTSSPFRNRLEQVLEDGSVIVNDVGYPGRDISLRFEPITSTTAALIERVQQWAGPVTYFDQDDNVFECIVRGGRVEMAGVGGGLKAASLDLTVLP